MNAGTPPIAIIGMACRFAGADNPEQYWENLVGEVESIARSADGAFGPTSLRSERHVPAIAKVDDVECFDADFFGVPPAEAVIMDPQQRVLLEVAFEALEDAGRADTTDAVVGVFVGSGENVYHWDFVASNPRVQAKPQDLRVVLANAKDFLASRIAFKLGLTGPSITVQTACSTALTAVALACQALVAGDCDVALAGGVSLLMPDVDGYEYSEGGIFSADGRCRAFDRLASGTVPGSGAGVVVLKRDDAARANGDNRRAVIRGWAFNNDGGSRSGFTAPNVEGQAAVVRAAMKRAGVRASEVAFIEAHGTATPIGDPVEVEGLRRAFGADACEPQSCAIGSVKTNIGHTDAAAGIAGLIKAAFAVERGKIPASLHFERPNPEIDFDRTPFYVNPVTVPWPRPSGARIAGVSSFGLGGMNAHVVLENAPPIEPAPPEWGKQPIVLSARNDDELERARIRLADWLDMNPNLSPSAFADVAYTLAVGRMRFGSRWGGAFVSPGEATAALREPSGPTRLLTRRALVVEGSADELVRMGVRLVSEDPLIRSVLGELVSAGVPEAAGDAGAVLLTQVLPAPQGAALVAVACIRALQDLGLKFARVDGPPWLGPVLGWLGRGAPMDELADAIAACGLEGSSNSGVERVDAESIRIGAAFDLPATVAAAWAAGVDVNWAAYYAHAKRRRTSLPTYPFTRRRFWLDRVRDTAAATDETPGTIDRSNGTGIADSVEAIWCEVLGRDEISRDAHFLDELGGDSMYAVEIGARLSEHFGIDLPLDLPFLGPTIAQSASYIEEALATTLAS